MSKPSDNHPWRNHRQEPEVRLKRLVQTCDFTPSQWEGQMKDGRYFYARYRWGWLTWGFGKNLKEAIGGSIGGDCKQLGDEFDGVLATATMLVHTGLKYKAVS